MLTEACLHVTGGTTRLGKIDDGTTASDNDEEEIRRKISLYTSVIPVEYKDTKINFLDTPGYTDFVGEVISALRVADGAIVLLHDAATGQERQVIKPPHDGEVGLRIRCGGIGEGDLPD